MVHSPCFYLPLPIPLPPCLYPLILTWNPPSCDRNRPPQSQVDCKLTPPILYPANVPSRPSRPLLGFPRSNVHSVRMTLQIRPISSQTRRVDTLRIVYYGESLLPSSLIAESHCWQQGVIFKNFEGLPLPLKGQWSKKLTRHVKHCWPRIV
jgi:hypothetical protein